MVIVLEYLAFFGALVSTYLYGNKSRWGPVSGMLVAVLFITFGVVAQIYAAAITNLFFLGLHARNFRKAIMDTPERRNSARKIAGQAITDYVVGAGKICTANEVRDHVQFLVQECHESAWNAGWWHNIETGEVNPFDINKRASLAHSELSEAMEAFRKDLMDDKLVHRPGLEVELADFLIRIFDCIGFLAIRDHNLDLDYVTKAVATDWPSVEPFDHGDVLRHIAGLHYFVSDWWLQFQGSRPTNVGQGRLADMIAATFTAGYDLGLDIPGALADKMEYNANRPDHRVENRLGDHGKKF